MSPPRSSAVTRVQNADAEPEGPIPPQRKGEPGPDTPLDLGPRDWKATITRAVKEIKDDRVPFAAAGMAYYFFLAMVPAFIALVGIMGIVNVDPQPMIDSIRSTLPGDAGTVLAQLLRRPRRRVVAEL